MGWYHAHQHAAQKARKTCQTARRYSVTKKQGDNGRISAHAGHLRMKRWFNLKTTASPDGYIKRLDLRTIDGEPADDQDDFVEQLEQHILGYATHENTDLDNVFNAQYHIPNVDRKSLSRRSIERLLAPDPDGGYRTLKGFTGECISHWLYQSFNAPQALTTPKAHSSEPAYDLIAINQAQDQIQVDCIQAKVSAGNASTLVSNGVDKYCELHSGKYDFELAAELHLLARTPTIKKLVLLNGWRRLLLQPDNRDYTIFIAYDGPNPDGPRNQWSAKWATGIPGSSNRRALITMELSDCERFIGRLAERLRANTT